MKRSWLQKSIEGGNQNNCKVMISERERERERERWRLNRQLKREPQTLLQGSPCAALRASWPRKQAPAHMHADIRLHARLYMHAAAHLISPLRVAHITPCVHVCRNCHSDAAGSGGTAAHGRRGGRPAAGSIGRDPRPTRARGMQPARANATFVSLRCRMFFFFFVVLPNLFKIFLPFFFSSCDVRPKGGPLRRAAMALQQPAYMVLHPLLSFSLSLFLSAVLYVCFCFLFFFFIVLSFCTCGACGRGRTKDDNSIMGPIRCQPVQHLLSLSH